MTHAHTLTVLVEQSNLLTVTVRRILFLERAKDGPLLCNIVMNSGELAGGLGSWELRSVPW